MNKEAPARDHAGLGKRAATQPPVRHPIDAKSVTITVLEGLGRINCCTPLRVLPCDRFQMKEV